MLRKAEADVWADGGEQGAGASEVLDKLRELCVEEEVDGAREVV